MGTGEGRRFKKGDRVRLSAAGREQFPQAKQRERLGTVCQQPTWADSRVVRVLWDGLRAPQPWVIDYLEPVMTREATMKEWRDLYQQIPAERRAVRRDEVMCDNCPFATSGRGARLRRALRPGRMREIKQAVLLGAPFYCHKTVQDDGWNDEGDSYTTVGRERVCGGSLRFVRAAHPPTRRGRAR